jgi:hypothetical protein
MNETLQEFFDSRGVTVRVDREAGVIRGVKILGLESRNQRSYLPEALMRAVPLYEGAKVNVNHPKGNPTGPRDYQDRLGTIRRVEARSDEGLFGDLHFNPRHALAEQLIWDAEHAPENVGFSHNVEAQTSRRGDRVVVEAITRVQSVDLVAGSATTRGLFESSGSLGASAASDLATVTLEELRRERPDLVAAAVAEQAAQTQRLQESLARLEAEVEAGRKEATAKRLLREFHLPESESAEGHDPTIVSRQFFAQLMALPDEAAMRELVAERARLVETLRRGGNPVSRDQAFVYGSQVEDVETFVKAICR